MDIISIGVILGAVLLVLVFSRSKKPVVAEEAPLPLRDVSEKEWGALRAMEEAAEIKLRRAQYDKRFAKAQKVLYPDEGGVRGSDDDEAVEESDNLN